MKKVSVMIPCYNEEENVEPLSAAVIEQIEKLEKYDYEILFIDNCSNDKTREKLESKYREIYLKDKKPNTVPFDGISDVIKKLKRKGYQVAINTNKAQPLVDDLCKEKFPEIKFDSVFGFTEDRPSKPDPHGVNELLKLHNVSREETVYIGDGLTDIETARNAVVDCVFVTWGQGENSLSRDERVSFVAKSPRDILSFINPRGVKM